MKGVLERSWISPLIAFSFLAISVTGLMMLFHIKGHIISHLHQWMGFLFVIAGIFHLICNWRGFLSCFRNKKQSAFAIFIVVAMLLLFGLSASFSGQSAQEYGNRGGYFRSHPR